MDIFRIDNSVADLDEQLNKRSVFLKCASSACLPFAAMRTAS